MCKRVIVLQLIRCVLESRVPANAHSVDPFQDARHRAPLFVCAEKRLTDLTRGIHGIYENAGTIV